MTDTTYRTETIDWTISDGRTATATVTLYRKMEHIGMNELTGKPVLKDRGLRITTRAAIDDASLGMGWLTRGCDLHGYGATIGRLAVPDDKLTEIDEAIARCEATPEWIEYVAMCAAAEQSEREYDADRLKIERTA